MLKVPSLDLPTVFPAKTVMQSHNHNETAYDPEFWELEYLGNRYLENASHEALIDRYLAISKSMGTLYSHDRHVIPIGSFLSTWYWFKKEHQSRLEFHHRGFEPPARPGTIVPMTFAAPARPQHPNSGDVLFRFSKIDYLVPMLREGRVRMTSASKYLDHELGSARMDNEIRKTRYVPGKQVRLITNSGQSIPIIGDLRRHVDMINYYIFCTSSDYRPTFFDEFEGSDACVVIYDVDTFAQRMEAAINVACPGWIFHHNPVEYFDPYESTSLNDTIDPIMNKDFRFAYQMEYRFVCFPPQDVPARQHIDLVLGPQHDVAFLYSRPA